MKARTELLGAFLLLAVIALTVIALYLWAASERAFRRAVAAEAEVPAQETARRLSMLRQDLEERLETLEALPVAR